MPPGGPQNRVAILRGVSVYGFMLAALRAPGIGAESPQDLHEQIRGLGADSPAPALRAGEAPKIWRFFIAQLLRFIYDKFL
jgi:hypothetical protein